MKIINVVGEGAERRTYVEGGPPCEAVSRGTGLAYWECINGRKINTWPGCYNKDVGECFVCHGTGLLAVELWPDAVKAEWLSDNIPEHFSWAIEDGYYVYTICQGEFTGERETQLAENDDFSAALTAAVIAVAEGE